MDFKVVPTGDLSPNTWNPNEMNEETFEKEVISIQRFGFVDPVTVRQTPEGLQIVDGEHRWKAAKALGLAEVPVVDIGVVEDHVAQQLTVVLNDLRGKPKADKLGQVLRTIAHSVHAAELCAVMPYQPETIASLIEGKVSSAELDAGGEEPPPEKKKREKKPDDGEFRTITWRLPEGVADQVDAQVERFKRALFPLEEPAKVSYVLPVEAMIQALSQIPDDQLL